MLTPMKIILPTSIILVLLSSLQVFSQTKSVLYFQEEVEARVSNSSNLIFKPIYYQKGGARHRVEFPYYFGNFEVLVKDSIYFRFKNNGVLKMVGDTVEWMRLELEGKPIDPVITAHACSQSSHVGYEEIFNTNLGEINLRFIYTMSNHTDQYKVSITNDEGKLAFKSLLNVSMYLADSDKDGRDEIFIFTYSAERQELMIIWVYKEPATAELTE